MPQRLRFLFRAMLLHDVERYGEHEHRDNDEKAAKVAADAGDGRGGDQKRDEGIEGAFRELDEQSFAMSDFKPIRTRDSKTFLSLLLG